MKTTTIIRGGAAAIVALAIAACNSSSHEEDSHAGHDHAGHDHGETPHNQNGICGEHNVPEEACGICNPDQIAQLKPGESLQLRLPSERSADTAGIKTIKANDGFIAEGLECYAELAFNQNRYAQIAAPVSGVIEEVRVEPGSLVEESQTVTRIWSAEIAETIAKAALSHQTLERERKLHREKVTPEKDLQEAEANHRAVCQSLRTLGFSEEQIDGFSLHPQEKVFLEARAPFAGEIIRRNAVQGARVDAGDPLFTLADRSVMWAELAIPEAAIATTAIGQTVVITIDSMPGRKFTGKVTWISAELDDVTRMGKARAEVPNPDGLLRAHMFAKARILTSKPDGVVMVPASSIQRVDGKPLIFVKTAADLFDARAIRLGPQSGDSWIIAEGLKSGEEVATDHAFVLKSQLLISRLGAGCADD